MSYFIDGNERVNKTALLLAQERYNLQYRPFVKSAARLSYLETSIERLLTEVCDEMGADKDWVTNRFLSFVTESVAWKPSEDGIPHGKNESTTTIDGVHKTDVMDHGDVPGAGLEEALDIGKKVDLNEDTQKAACFRCGSKLSSVVSPVCPECTAALKKVADFNQDTYTVGDATSPGASPVGEEEPLGQIELPYHCDVCHLEGTQEEIRAHISTDHQDILRRDQEINHSEPYAGVENQSDPSNFSLAAGLVTAEVGELADEDAAKVQPLPESPADKFDAMVQDLADRAAAAQFSNPDQQQIHSLASQLGLSPDDLQTQLITVATFGGYSGRNGELSEDTQIPEGYEEVSTDLNAQANTQKALVPTKMVIDKVAEQMAMTPELAYQMVKDKYGDDLPDKYHAPVSGELHYYLPTELAGNQQGAQQAEMEQQQMEQQPAAPPAPDAQAPVQPQF